MNTSILHKGLAYSTDYKFVNDGKIAMTNLVFPNEPYNQLEFYNDKSSSTVKDMHICELKL